MEILITKLIKLLKICRQPKNLQNNVIFRAIRKNEKWTFINVQILKIDWRPKTRKIKKNMKNRVFRVCDHNALIFVFMKNGCDDNYFC